jgi:MFS family permease
MGKLFALVAAVVLVDTMFYAAITPLLPHYVDELGLSKSAAGILTACYGAGTLIGSLPGGWLASRLGARTTMVAGLALMSTASLVFAFAGDIVTLDGARFLQGVGGAFSWAGGLAWLLARSPGDRRGELIGSAVAAAIAGVMLGPLLGGAATVTGPAPVFTAVCAIGIGLAAWALSTPAAPPPPRRPLDVVLRTMASRPVVVGFWLVSLPALFSGVLGVLGPLRLDELGAGGVAIGAIFLAAAAIEGFASRLFGGLSDRRGRMAPIRAGLLISLVAALLLPIPDAVLALAAAIVVAVVGMAFFWAPAMALLSDAADVTGLDQGFAFGLVNLAWAGGEVVGGSGGAALADSTSDVVPYFAVAACLALTLAAFALPRSGRVPATSGGG